MIWGYRGALGLVVVALLCPWIAVHSSASVNYGDAGRDMSAAGLGSYGGNTMQNLGNQKTSLDVSVSGVSTLWGQIALLVTLAGIAVSFVGPSKILPEKEKITMSAVGGVIFLLTLIAWFTVNSYVKGDVSFSSQYSSASASASAAFGLYLSLLGGVASGGLGFLMDWRTTSLASGNQRQA